MRKTSVAGIVAGVVATIGFAAFPASAATSDAATLSVLHGIPDTPVDVYVNGERALDDFAPGDLAGPLELAAGDYQVALTAADAADASAPVLGPVTLTLKAGTNSTAVAHLNEGGDPTVTPFVNDTSATEPGEGRLTVRHVAAAPTVDVLAGGTPVIEGLANPDEQTLNLPAGTVPAAVALAGTTDPVIGPADVPVEEGALTVVYAWGSAEAGNLAVAVQTVTGLHTNPDGVPSGTSGALAAQDQQATLMWVGFGALGAAAAAFIATRRPARVGVQHGQ